MANSFQLWSISLDKLTAEQVLFLASRIMSAENLDMLLTDGQKVIAKELNPNLDFEDDLDEEICSFKGPEKLEPEGNTVYLYSEESGDLSGLVAVLQDFTTEFSIPYPITLEWADTCSKPRPDEFGGGAFVVFKGEAYWHTTTDWVNAKINELMPTPTTG